MFRRFTNDVAPSDVKLPIETLSESLIKVLQKYATPNHPYCFNSLLDVIAPHAQYVVSDEYHRNRLVEMRGWVSDPQQPLFVFRVNTSNHHAQKHKAAFRECVRRQLRELRSAHIQYHYMEGDRVIIANQYPSSGVRVKSVRFVYTADPVTRSVLPQMHEAVEAPREEEIPPPTELPPPMHEETPREDEIPPPIELPPPMHEETVSELPPPTYEDEMEEPLFFFDLPPPTSPSSMIERRRSIMSFGTTPDSPATEAAMTVAHELNGGVADADGVDHLLQFFQEEHSIDMVAVQKGPLVVQPLAGSRNGSLHHFCFFPILLKKLQEGTMVVDDINTHIAANPTLQLPLKVISWYALTGQLDAYEHMMEFLTKHERELQRMSQLDFVNCLLQNKCVLHLQSCQ